MDISKERLVALTNQTLHALQIPASQCQYDAEENDVLTSETSELSGQVIENCEVENLILTLTISESEMQLLLDENDCIHTALSEEQLISVLSALIQWIFMTQSDPDFTMLDIGFTVEEIATIEDHTAAVVE